jgi:hypothetical protein
MFSRPILLFLLAAATFGLVLSLWDAWNGRIRTEDGFMPTSIRDKRPSLYDKLIAGNVVMSFVVFAIVSGLVLWFW